MVSLHNFMDTAKIMIRDVPVMEKELHRLAVQYPPLPKANFRASLKDSALPTSSP